MMLDDKQLNMLPITTEGLDNSPNGPLDLDKKHEKGSEPKKRGILSKSNLLVAPTAGVALAGSGALGLMPDPGNQPSDNRSIPIVESSGDSGVNDRTSLSTTALQDNLLAVTAAIGGTIAGLLVIGLLTGIVQKYARKQRYQAVNSFLWSKLAIVPSLAQPYPFGYTVSWYDEGEPIKLTKTWEIYKRLALVPAIRDPEDNQIYLLDDWGGFASFSIDRGVGKEFVIAHTEQAIKVISKSGLCKWFTYANLTEIAGYLWYTSHI